LFYHERNYRGWGIVPKNELKVKRFVETSGVIDGIEFDQERKGYTFTNGDRIKKLTLSDNELLVLLVANEKLGGYFSCIFARLNERRTVELVYRAQATKEVTDRLVGPYGLVFYDGIWTLVGYCHLRKGIRTFSFDRIIEVKERYLYFKLQDSFDLEEYLSHSWGIVDDEEVTVKVRFTAKAADYVLRKKWHPSERRVALPNGDVELTYTVAGIDEIRHWIYSWLPNVEILEPEWFRQQAAEKLSHSLEKHQQEFVKILSSVETGISRVAMRQC
jgi:hypothetical protein